MLLLGLVTGLAAACGGDSAGPAPPPPPPPPPPNRAPTTVGTMPAVELAVGETETLDVSQYFSDPDGDALSYSRCFLGHNIRHGHSVGQRGHDQGGRARDGDNHGYGDRPGRRER